MTRSNKENNIKLPTKSTRFVRSQTGLDADEIVRKQIKLIASLHSLFTPKIFTQDRTL